MSDKNGSSFWDKLSIFQRLRSVKHIEVFVIIIFFVVLGIIFFSNLNLNDSSSNSTSAEFDFENYSSNLERKLENVISEIKGAGKVSIMISFDGGIRYEYAKQSEEVTTSSTLSGGTNSKTTTNESLVIVTQNGKSTPLIVKQIYPDVVGVVVVSSGAKDVSVKLNIISAISTLLEISDNKIEVLVGEK